MTDMQAQEMDLFAAIQYGDLAAVVQQLETDGNLVNLASEKGETPFELALKHGFKKIAIELSNHPSFQVNNGSCSPLQTCLTLGYLDLAEDLLAKGANPNFTTPDFTSPLLLALESEFYALAELMVRSGAEVNIRNNSGWTPLIWAAIKGRIKAVEFLLAHGADVNICNNDGWNAVTGAYFKKRTDIVNLLMAKGAVFGAKYAEAALLSAYKEGNLELVNRLLDMGTTPNVSDDNGESLLAKTISRGDKTLAIKLLEMGADPNARLNSSPLLFLVSGEGDSELVCKFLEHGASVNLPNDKGATALLYAASFNHYEIGEKLIEHGANVNATAVNSTSTPTIVAAVNGYHEFIAVLLKANANIEIRSADSKTPLDIALNMCKLSVSGSVNEAQFNKCWQILLKAKGFSVDG
ncbi:ankyrin repeat domain-containing protein [Pelagibaculum spongiae]|uniref:Uncharacterized protein n=1 Tax=Pelagibaculum spongiae TaxID=2080658 RepID=A0A2V1GQS8_9GAMM|nr:ankyrin repeat domain-containing protein [Pelagibaculum spongiae]PVZ65654.1 hypothetical protein DC094_17360 [Pelagibaculum spongiae]